MTSGGNESRAADNDESDDDGEQFDAMDESRAREATNGALDGVAAMMKLARKGDATALVELRKMAVGITRHLHKHHSDSMRRSGEFPVVLSAGNEQRRQELDAYKTLPIGASVGFPHRPGEKSGASYDDSPAGFWRETQFWIDALRGFTEIARDDLSSIIDGAGIPFAVSLGLLEKIATLPDFGDGCESEWLEVGLELIASNPGMIPDWIRDRTVVGSRGGKQRGLGHLWDGEIRKGFGYCWPPPKMKDDF
jgi:hypothetical protein